MGGIGEYIAKRTPPPPKGIGETIARRTPPPKGIGETIARKYAAEETKKQLERGTYKLPTPEPVKEGPPTPFHRPGFVPISPFTGRPLPKHLTQAELTSKVVKETYLVRGKEKEFTSGIDPTKTYTYRLTTPEEGAYIHAITTGEPITAAQMYKGYGYDTGRTFNPYDVVISGSEIIKGAESLAKEREQGVTEQLRWIAKHPPGTTFRVTATGYEVYAPAKTISLKEWKEQEYKGLGVAGTIRRGVATFLGGVGQHEWAYERLFGKPERAEAIITGWEYGAKAAIKKGPIEYIKYVAPSPPLTSFVYPFIGAYAFGAGIGALKMTAWGVKPLAKVAFTYPPAIVKPITVVITPAKIVETAIVGYGVYETGKAFRERPIETAKYLAVTFPLIYAGYRYGAVKGMGYVQRRAAMAKVTGISRVRQKAIYEAIEVMWKKGKGIKPLEKPYALARVERLEARTIMDVSRFLTAEQKRFIFGGRPRVGGAVAMEMYGVRRTGVVPSALRQWAVQRQAISGRLRPMMGAEAPKDIDIWIRSVYKDITGGMKRAKEIRIPHVIDVPKVGYKPYRYYWGGWTELPSARAEIYGVAPIKIRVPLLRELFMRKAVSILPSETRATGYRSYKDIFDFFYLAQKVESKKMTAAIDKVVQPWKYAIPKRTIGERFISRIGGAVEPVYKEDAFGIYPTYPKGVYPTPYAPVAYYAIGKPTLYYVPPAGAYKVSPYKLVIPSIYKPTYVPKIVPTYERKYPPKKLALPYEPPYRPPPYTPSIPPSLAPPYTPPPYAPYKAPYKPSKYPPGIPPTVPPPKTPILPIYIERKRKPPVEEKEYGLRYRLRIFTYPKIKTPKTIVPKSVISYGKKKKKKKK